MDVNECYRIVLLATAKNKQDGYVSPDDFNLAMNNGQRMYLDYLLGEYQKYQPKRPIAVVEFGQNERIRESLAPLIYGANLFPNTTTGIAAFPSDYEYSDNMWGLYGFYNIRFAQQDRLDSFIHSSIDPIAENPIYLIQHEGFHFFPENFGSARLSYVRKPPSIVWGWLPDSNGIPTYNAATSQDPIWGDSDILQVIARALQWIGVNLQFNMVVQYANEVKTQGQ